jgi:four helix bundle suffix protein
VLKRGTKGTTGTKDSIDAGFIPPHGGYEDLLSYQKALIVYDATLHFCNRFFTKFDRTREQMIQRARAGKQNILEASVASGTSKETEIKLTNTARASLQELLEDYRDFIRNRGIEEWSQDFLKEGGLRERMTRARIAVRNRQGRQ